MATQTTPENPSHHETIDRLAGVAHSAVDRAAEYGGRAEERLRETTDHATETARQARERAAARSHEANDQVLGYVRDHPYASLGIAAAAGFLIGSIIRRR